jgi:hypothetical protein
VTPVPLEDDLIWYLTWRIRQEDGVPAKTRLVKLLYLVDLLNVRDRGSQLTSFHWIFYHYGPWASEVDRVIDRNLGNTIALAGRSSYYGDSMFRYRELSWPPESLLDDRVRRYCDQVCDEWAVEDLNDLLSYVYFETPPMEGAVRGERLDLERVRGTEWPARAFALGAPEISQHLRERWSDWRRRTTRDFPIVALEPAPAYDEQYENAVTESADIAAEPVRGRLVIRDSTDVD